MIFFQNFNILSQNPTPFIPVREQAGECEFALPAIAEMGSVTNDLYNDYHRFIAFFPSIVTSATAKLLKPDGTEVNIGSYGTVSTLGYFTNSLNQKPFSVYIDWHAVLNDIGIGCYRIILRGVFGSTTITEKSFLFNLQAYSEETINETVRVEWTLTGQLGSYKTEQEQRDFDTQEYRNCLRLPSAYFGEDSSDPEFESVRYKNGQKLFTSQNRKTKYIFKTGFYPYAVHKFIEFDMLMGENVEITDFNEANPTLHTQTKVTNFGEYAPEWNIWDTEAKAEVECESEFDNHYKFRI